MAKKKATKTTEKTAKTLKEALGIDKIFYNERINFVVGFCLLIIGGYLIWAFVSYLFTGAADQSLIESPRNGEMLNEKREFANSCGSLGAYAAHFFIKRCFGLGAFLIPVFMLMAAVNLMRAYQVQLLKWFMSLTIVMLWYLRFHSPGNYGPAGPDSRRIPRLPQHGDSHHHAQSHEPIPLSEENTHRNQLRTW